MLCEHDINSRRTLRSNLSEDDGRSVSLKVMSRQNGQIVAIDIQREEVDALTMSQVPPADLRKRHDGHCNVTDRMPFSTILPSDNVFEGGAFRIGFILIKRRFARAV